MNLNRIELPIEFYEPEERSGYMVTSELKKIWAVELDLASKLLEVCSANGIQISAFAGTVLGAVRHSGFIPWDDDMDFCMSREEFNKLISLPASEFQHPYYLQTTLGDQRFFCPYARLRNSETTGIVSWNKSPEYNNGIFIDIFVLDGFTENKLAYIYQFVKWSFYRTVLENYNGQGKVYKKIDRFNNCIGKKLSKLRRYEEWVNLYNKSISMNTPKTNRLSLMTHGRSFSEKYWLYKEELFNTKLFPFENIELPVPENYDSVLSRMYGNYMEYPPVEQRGLWHQNKIIFDPNVPYKEYFDLHPEL